MSKIDVDYTAYLKETVSALKEGRVLLASVGKNGKPNAMTIGWGTIGIIWAKPVFAVLVRPSRHTYKLMEETNDFTVNIAPPELSGIANYCGTVSGKDHDKFEEKGLTAIPGKTVKSPIIEECIIHYECKTVNKNDVIKENLSKEIVSGCYPKGDYHKIYFGEILLTRANNNLKR